MREEIETAEGGGKLLKDERGEERSWWNRILTPRCELRETKKLLVPPP